MRCSYIGSLVPCSRLNDGSRMSREIHVRFCKGLGVKLPRATYPSFAPIDELMNSEILSIMSRRLAVLLLSFMSLADLLKDWP